MADYPYKPDQVAAVTHDDLLGLVAGSLDASNFERVSRVVAPDPLLRQRVEQLDQIREGVLRHQVLAENPAAIEATQKSVLGTLATVVPPSAEVRNRTIVNDSSFSQWLRKCWLFICRPANVGLAYSFVAVQAVVIVLLASNVMPGLDGDVDTGAMRGSTQGSDSKQLGTQQDNVFFAISFAANTPESTFRALLLEIQADIVSGPNQLGQYRVSVARNRSYLAQLKLREAEFVEQVLEIKP